MLDQVSTQILELKNRGFLLADKTTTDDIWDASSEERFWWCPTSANHQTVGAPTAWLICQMLQRAQIQEWEAEVGHRRRHSSESM